MCCPTGMPTGWHIRLASDQAPPWVWLHHMAKGVGPSNVSSPPRAVSSLVQELGPKAALRQLALPLVRDTASQRAQGLRQVHSIVFGQDAMLGSTGVQLLQEARAHMTAAEQVGLSREKIRTVPACCAQRGPHATCADALQSPDPET